MLRMFSVNNGKKVCEVEMDKKRVTLYEEDYRKPAQKISNYQGFELVENFF